MGALQSNMVETVGTQLKRARVARALSLEDAARETKIRAVRLADLEADVYTNFPNLAYARGFLTSYGKYLAVDVRPYLDAFENTSTFGVDDYQYLSETPVGVYRAPRRVYRQRAPRKRLVALGATLGVLAMTMFGWFCYINYLRLGDLNKLADHQDSRGHQATELNPTAMLARPIPSESPALPGFIPPAAKPAMIVPDPATATPVKTTPPSAAPMPTEVVMMEKLATVQPPVVPEPAVAAVVNPLAPVATAPATIAAAPAVELPEVEPPRDHQLVENRAVTPRAAPAVNSRRLSARSADRGANRVSFESAPATPPKSFE